MAVENAMGNSKNIINEKKLKCENAKIDFQRVKKSRTKRNIRLKNGVRH